MELILEAPNWLLALCVLAGAVYSAALYTRDRLNRHFDRWVIIGLAALRFSAVSLIAFFLLRPLLKTTEREVEKPIVVIAQDNSESLVVGGDSSAYRSTYAQELQAFSESLGEDYDVRTYRFGSRTSAGIDSLDFSEKTTDYSTLLDELYTTFSNRNLGAVVVGSDGLYNRGTDPVYAFQKLNAPVFTIALGDTTPRRDVRIAEVVHNRLAYLGNQFPVEIRVEGREVDGEQALVTISRKGQTLYSQTVSFAGSADQSTLRTTLEATETGLQQYAVSVTALDGEVTRANNRKSFFIDVLDSRQQVVILHRAPHPDVRAIREALEANSNYEVTVSLLKEFDGNLEGFNLAVLHDLPDGTAASQALTTQLEEAEVPSWFIWGMGTRFNVFNRLGTGFGLTGASDKTTDVSAVPAENFSLFTLEESTTNMLRSFPPLTIPFGDFEVSPGVSVLAYQQVGKIQTELPLMGFNKSEGRKLAVTVGEGLWRWRLFDFLENQDHRRFDELVSKTVQFLAAKEDKGQFRVRSKNDFLENERIAFDAEVYNASYEPITAPEVTMVIRSADGQAYDRVFTRTSNAYRLDAGQMPAGQYTYDAEVTVAGESFLEKGEFSVTPVQLELTETRANHRMLYNFATRNGGEMVVPGEWDRLRELVTTSRNVQTVSHESRILTDLINTRWLMFVIIGLLGLEWLWRKRNGTY